MKLRLLIISLFVAGVAGGVQAQTELYPRHFDLEEVTLLDGPMKTAMYRNIDMLLQYDTDRLLTPYVRQSGLSSVADSEYYQWTSKHPNFPNWGDSSFDLSGHVGGHYLSALALAYASCHDADRKAQLKERLDYMVKVLRDCQNRYDQNTQGLYGFIGGQPINSDWVALFQGNTAPLRSHGGWVPLYVQHKILAGLRDAFLYGNSDEAKEVFRKLADWSVNVIQKVSDSDMETLLGIEHGGMNESLLDAYQLFGDAKYLTAARRYTHKQMLNGLQTLSTTFLDNKHANTQVPKYIGMERIGEVESAQLAVANSSYLKAAENFWTDVALNRTVCIGGNSVAEHFLAKANSNRYIDQLDGPETCNSNNMLKLSEMMSDRTIATDPQAAARYADFYEQTLWNHILSTQDPLTGGYVYFTTLRPQGYRIYSQPNQGMWCCVGTGMENHSKYGHFIYTRYSDGQQEPTLYVNLFTASKLESDDFVVTQETDFPFTPKSTLTIGKAGQYAVAVRHPAWAGQDFQVTVNGTPVSATTVQKGKAGYVTVSRNWAVGDKIEVTLPMELRYEECPNYTDYIAFKYGPILLAAQTTAASPDEAQESGLTYEQLQNEYAGEGRMDHAPGSRATSKNLTTAPLLIGNRADVLSRIERLGTDDLRFRIDVSREGVESYRWTTLTLVPFYQIHHARYQCYWYQQTEENYANSTMAQTEAANEALAQRTLDFVAPGEQQSEAGHEYNYSSDSSTGDYNTEHYRDARAGGHIQYTLYNPTQESDRLSVMFRFNLADRGRKATLTVDGTQVADITIPATAKGSDANGFYNVEYPIPEALVTDADGQVKTRFVVRLTASSSTLCPGIYYVRLMKGYDNHAYTFRAADWTTGDASRVAASRITYDEQQNIIHVNAGTGANNVALMMKYNQLEYTIDKSQIFLVVRGDNLKTTTGASYLWWLNGINHGSQVPPTATRTITIDGKAQTVFAWDLTKSGLYENFSGDRPSVCAGQTIFGLTSTTGLSDIYDINFVSNVDDYVAMATSIAAPVAGTVQPQEQRQYDLQGRPAANVSAAHRTIVVSNGYKQVK